jgi:hypothetical protein
MNYIEIGWGSQDTRHSHLTKETKETKEANLPSLPVEDSWEWIEERAAILEFEAGMERETANYQAFMLWLQRFVGKPTNGQKGMSENVQSDKCKR